MTDWPAYWDERYRSGRGSGKDSVGEHAQRKAAYVNDLIRRERITSVIDWGCGDGVVQALIDVEHYVGVDWSEEALRLCREARPDRRFYHRAFPAGMPAELGLSMSVVYHLVDDADYEMYLERLFLWATRFVVILSTDVDRQDGARHMRHRLWSADVPPGWEQRDFTPWYPDRTDDTLGFHLLARRT